MKICDKILESMYILSYCELSFITESKNETRIRKLRQKQFQDNKFLIWLKTFFFFLTVILFIYRVYRILLKPLAIKFINFLIDSNEISKQR